MCAVCQLCCVCAHMRVVRAGAIAGDVVDVVQCMVEEFSAETSKPDRAGWAVQFKEWEHFAALGWHVRRGPDCVARLRGNPCEAPAAARIRRIVYTPLTPERCRVALMPTGVGGAPKSPCHAAVAVALGAHSRACGVCCVCFVCCVRCVRCVCARVCALCAYCVCVVCVCVLLVM